MPINFIEIRAIPIVILKGQTQVFMYDGLMESTGVAALMSFQEVEKRLAVLETEDFCNKRGCSISQKLLVPNLD